MALSVIYVSTRGHWDCTTLKYFYIAWGEAEGCTLRLKGGTSCHPFILFLYSGTCLIRHTKAPGKCIGLYRMSEYACFILVNRNSLGPLILSEFTGQWNGVETMECDIPPMNVLLIRRNIHKYKCSLVGRIYTDIKQWIISIRLLCTYFQFKQCIISGNETWRSSILRRVLDLMWTRMQN